MKHLITCCILLLSYSTSKSVGVDFKTFEIVIHSDITLETIIEVETHNENVAGSTSDIGYLQITPIFVREVNRIIGYNKYKLIDRWNKKKSIEMYYIYQKYYNPTYDFKLACLYHHRASNINEQLEYFKKCKVMAIKVILQKCNPEHRSMIMNYISNQKQVKHRTIEVKTENLNTNFKIINSKSTLVISLSPSTHNIPLSIGNLFKYLL